MTPLHIGQFFLLLASLLILNLLEDGTLTWAANTTLVVLALLSLVEVLIAVAVVAILTIVSLPSYAEFVKRGTRADAQAIEEAANLRDKIKTLRQKLVGKA